MVIRRSKVICLLMLMLIIIYYSQGVLYPMGTILSQTALLLLLAISGAYLVMYIFVVRRSSSFVRAWTILLMLNLIYFVFDGSLAHIDSFQAVLLNMLPFYAFFIFAQENILQRRHLIIFFLVLLPLVIVRFVTSYVELQEFRNKEDVVDNTVYMFFGLLPFVFLFKNRIISISILFTILTFIIQSGKRAAFVAGIITLVVYIYFSFKSFKGNQYYFWRILLFLVLFLVVGAWGYNRFLENEFLIYRLTLMLEGDSAGRDLLASQVFDFWYDSDNVFVYLFGHGFQTSEKVTSIGSHNDWLDILASFGIFGFLSYVFLFVFAGKEIFWNDWNYMYKGCFISLILIAFVASLTSRWYWSSFAYSQMLLLPYLVANNSKSLRLTTSAG